MSGNELETVLKNIVTPIMQPPSPAVAEHLKKQASYGACGELLQGVELVLAGNPKDYTGPGTNTYLVGAQQVWIIDPGPACNRHIDAVLAQVAGRDVVGILVTHTHADHSPAADIIAAETGASTYGFGMLSSTIAAQTGEDVDANFSPDVMLSHGQKIGVGSWRVEAVHTPGHFPNHMAYYMPEQGLLFSGDHVMGWSTTLVVPPLGNMAEYLASLDILQGLNAAKMLPSHGPIVEDPHTRIQEIREHRLARQKQVEACVRDGLSDPAEIVNEIYEGLTERLLSAAEGCVQAHLDYFSHRSDFEDKQIIAATHR